ncbi:acyltransferase family protein [Escherichia coli]|uniref:acyltransferase family protein n=1 Tax=Escherichia coli TaxID=562 RepID=UPI0007D959C7|nr:acyltransferase family protein [Escherichia coli]EGO9621567.1 acyltransferase [Escherichia coli]
MSYLKYRTDIGGLRAIAVMAVVLYHFGVKGFSGGFSGVDIFFVISGYLMTGIIYTKIENENFSLLGFYLDRARRIIPALTVVSVAVLIVGYFILLPSEYECLAQHVRSSLLFFSNVEYYHSIDYFDTASKQKWLLHTWSLSVEWQFYMVYPIIMMVIAKLLGAKHIRYVVAILAIISFTASVYLSYNNQGAAFYLLSSRAWEMLAGGLAYLLPTIQNSKRTAVFRWIAIAFAVSGIVLLNSLMKWPGYLALIPVVSTFFVIYLGCKDNLLLDNALSQWVGKISYSVYLVHWPIVVYMSMNKMDDMVYTVSGVALSILIGAASFYLIENPSRKALSKFKNGRSLNELTSIVLPVGGVVGLCFAVLLLSGIPSRFSFATMTSEQLKEQMNRYWVDGDKPHPVPKTGDKKIVIIGNSHGIDLTYALTENGMKGDITYIRTTNLCSNFGYTPNDMPYVEKCKKIFNDVISSPAIAEANIIILHDDYGVGDLFGMLYSIGKIQERTKGEVIVFGPKMKFTAQPMEIIKSAFKSGVNTIDGINKYSKKYYDNSRVEINNTIKGYLGSNQHSYKYIDTLAEQCGKSMNCDILSTKGDYLYFDNSHFTLEGSREFGKKLKNDKPFIF